MFRRNPKKMAPTNAKKCRNSRERNGGKTTRSRITRKRSPRVEYKTESELHGDKWRCGACVVDSCSSFSGSHSRSRCAMCGSWFIDKEQETGTSTDTTHRHIPGFFYDTEKKRYFRITSDNPKPKSDNQQRLDAQKKCMKCTLAKKRKPQSLSLVKYILSRPYQPASPSNSRSDCLERLICQAEIRHSLYLDPITDNYVDVNSYAVCTIEPDANCRRILTLYKANPPGNLIVQFHELLKDRNNNLSICPYMSMTKTQQVTSLLWSPHQHSSDFYLLSLLGYGNMPGETMLFEVDGRSQRLAARFPVAGNSVWSSAWNRNPLYDHIISIGGSRVALTLDVNTRRRVIHVKCDSDVFAQQFAIRSPILYNGSRDGQVRTCDIRLKGACLPVICLSHGQHAPVICIRVLQDENYVLSSAMNGSMKLWDTRMCKSVQDYFGHNNKMTHGLQFYVDSTDTLIFGAGEDSLARIWSVRSGELIRTIPFPDDCDRELSSIPALYYADEWGGPGGMPGLLYGTRDRISFYSL